MKKIPTIQGKVIYPLKYIVGSIKLALLLAIHLRASHYQPTTKDYSYRIFWKSFSIIRKCLLYDKGILVADRKSLSVGTSLNGMIALAWFCEKMKIDIKIKSPTRMIWRHFENNTIINTTDNKNRDFISSRKRFFNSMNLGYTGRFHNSSEYGYKVLSKLSIKASLKQSANGWFDKHIKGNWIAVHYRGTDVEKRSTIKIDNYIIYLKGVLGNQSSIFACSDEQQFIDKMREVFPGRVFARDIVRSYDGRPIHSHNAKLKEIDNFQQEQDAFIDMLILAKAKQIYTTGSNFVDVTRYSNPNIKIVTLDNRKIGRGENSISIPNKDLYNKLCKKKHRKF